MRPIETIVALVANLVLAGCAGDAMTGYHGRPITDVARRFGPPVEIFDLASGERAFVWTIDAHGRPGPPPPWHFQSIEQQAAFRRGNFLASGACVYELIGRKDAASGDWIVRRLVDPGLACQ